MTLDNNKDIAQRQCVQLDEHQQRPSVRQRLNDKLEKFKRSGKKEAADYQFASNAGNLSQSDDANFTLSRAESAVRSRRR